MDPEQIQQAQPAQQTQEFASPEQKQQLMNLIDLTRKNLSEVNSAKFIGENSANLSKREALKEVFTILERSGVDLKNPASVSEFLNRLREQSPEMADLLEESLDGLLGEQTSKEEEEAELEGGIPELVPEEGPEESNIDINNETLSQNIRGRDQTGQEKESQP